MVDHSIIPDMIQFVEFSSAQTFGAPFSFLWSAFNNLLRKSLLDQVTVVEIVVGSFLSPLSL